MPKYTTTLILAAVFALLAAYAFFVESKKPEPDQFNQHREVLWSHDKAALAGFTVEDDGKKATYLRKGEGEDWEIKESPKNKPIDGTKFSYPLDQVREMFAETKVVDKADALKDFGLDKPKTTLTVDTKAKAGAEKIVFGDETPLKTGFYAKRADQDPVYEVASYRVTELKRLVSSPPIASPSPSPSPVTMTLGSPSPGASAAPPKATPKATASPAGKASAKPSAGH